MKWSELKKKLREAGFELLRQGRGSHEIWHNPKSNIKITISAHDSKEIGTGLANDLMKKARLK